MPAMPKREIFERIIQNITNKFPDVYAALFISPEGFPINTWGVSLERAEEISALLSALIGKTWEIVRGVKEGGELAFIQIQTNMGGIISPAPPLFYSPDSDQGSFPYSASLTQFDCSGGHNEVPKM